MIWQHHVTKGWSNMNGSPSWPVTSLPTLVTISTSTVEIGWSHKTTWLKGHVTFGQEPIKVNYRLVMFVSHGHCGSEDTMILVCQVISHDNMIKGFLRLLRQVAIKVSHPAKFGGQKRCGSKDIMILVCHVTLQDHVIRWSIDFKGRGPSR